MSHSDVILNKNKAIKRTKTPFSKRRNVGKNISKSNFKISFPSLSLDSFNVISFVVIALVVFFSALSYSEVQLHSQEMQNMRLTSEKQNNRAAFAFLMKSGKNRFERLLVEDAYSEFKLAYRLYPENEELKQYLFETLSILCQKQETYCQELDNLKL